MDAETRSLFPLESDRKNGLYSSQWQAAETALLGTPYFCLWPEVNLAIIATVTDDVKQSTGQEIRINQIPLDCRDTFSMLRLGDQEQFSTWGAESLEMIKRIQPDNLSDLFIVSAASRMLERPEKVEQMVAAKFEDPKIEMDHPILLDILGETYGCIVYGGQARMLMRQVGQFTEEMIEVRGSRKALLLQAMRSQFLTGATASGIDSLTANQIWFELTNLNREFEEKASHAPNVLLFYVLAYLATHYPDAVRKSVQSVKPAFYRSTVLNRHE